MADDIVTDLRAFSAYEGEGASLMSNAADEIERLRNIGDALVDSIKAVSCAGLPQEMAALTLCVGLWKQVRRG